MGSRTRLAPKMILQKYEPYLSFLFFFPGSTEDDDRHFLERLGAPSDASNMACMVSRFFIFRTMCVTKFPTLYTYG